MNKVVIRELDKKNILDWARLWGEFWGQDSWCLRSHSVEMYSYKYLNRKDCKAYVINSELNNNIGYFGVQAKNINYCGATYKIVEFSDFIINPVFRENGYYSASINQFMDEGKENYDGYFFSPINRQAYLALRLLFNNYESYEINNWFVTSCKSIKELISDDDSQVDIFECINIPVTLHEILGKSNEGYLKYAKDQKYLTWRYLEIPDRHQFCMIMLQNVPAGYFVYKEIEKDDVRGSEITDIHIDIDIDDTNFNRILLNIISFLESKNSSFFTLKTLVGNQLDVFMQNITGGVIKDAEKNYIIAFGRIRGCLRECNIRNNWLFNGEDWDIPRSGSYIENMIKKHIKNSNTVGYAIG
ncbi:hypothetical protein [Pelosinus sp. IPA-1]|uniref:hypothetical protein n=1 Tax=Pelosinus sp. IPA-1 TaxID=3029569 RepID=UPI00243627F8|nr:hypothetical protein [Pelosinus sp. IPA-1]GMA98538.1 hypothetical protein PIPA1_13380 [Pelosinus sp. IPA-1]